MIFCDSGLTHLVQLHVASGLTVGDVDSRVNPCMTVETIILPWEKTMPIRCLRKKRRSKEGSRASC